MKGVLTLVLVMCGLRGLAQEPVGMRTYVSAEAGYQLTYPGTWQLSQNESKTATTFYTGPVPPLALAAATLTVRLLPEEEKNLNPLGRGQLDSVWRSIQRLPRSQVLSLRQQEAGSYQQVRYDYTYAPDSAAVVRTRVLGRRVWRGGREFQLEYRAAASQQARYLAEGQRLVDSFLFGADSAAEPATAPRCDDKMYGIAALRYHNDMWEDDCRTIHEFSAADPSRPPKIHRQVLPFQSYALAKGFDNCLYSVTKAPTNAPEYVYRYNPATRRGEYTTWQLPAQGGVQNVWISGATDEQGDLYFMTSDASKLVKISPATNAVTALWTTDPVRQAPYYAAIGFAGAGSHGNFCLDDTGTLYEVYSTDGSLLQIDLNTRQPAPKLTPLTGLPERGGYSDLLFQTDPAGRRRLYLAGPKALYWVEVNRREAHLVRRGVYTDLAGCNLFRATTPPPATAGAAAGSTWRGRVLDADTYQPLPQAQLQLRAGGTETTVPLTPDGAFSVPVAPNQSYAARIQLTGYRPTDTTYTTRAGGLVQDLLVPPFRVGTVLRLDNVQFEQGKTRLLPASYPALDQLLTLLRENPALKIELRGHTDNVGDPQKNLVLSEQRVAAVKIYLVGLGIREKRITGIGLGGAEPRASNAREATRQLNRRVEFRVTEVR